MSFNGQISGSLAPQGAKTGSVSGNIGAVTPAIRDGAVTTAKIADAAVTIAKLAQDVTALINSKGDASDVAQLQSDVEALQTITDGLGTASTYGVANNLTQSASGVNVLDAAQGKALGDRLTTAEGDIDTLNDGYTNLALTIDSILEAASVPTTATSYSCAWSDYDLLIIQSCFYSNVRESIVVTKGYFAVTSSNSRVMLYDNQSGGRIYEVYKNGTSAVYAAITTGSAGTASLSLKIYGVKLAK